MEFLFPHLSFHIEPLRARAYLRGGRAALEVSMFDILFMAIGLGFLTVAMLYAVACDRL